MSGTRSFLAVLRRLRRYPSLWLVVLFFLNVAIPSSPPLAHSQNAQSPDPPTRLHGTVINSVTREPIAHALVFSTDNRLAGFTDDLGRFEFQLPRSESAPNVPPGGRAFYSGSVQLNARKPGFIDSAIAGPMVSDDMTIRLTPESLIVGRVNLPSSNQFDRITVEVYWRNVRDGRPFWTPVPGVSTRSNGEFRVANLAAGSYKIFTDELLDRDPTTFVPGGRLFGYPPVHYPAARDFASASAISLEAGKTVQVELTPILQPYYRVKIAFANIEPGSGVNVSVALDGHQGPGYSLGDNGESSIEGMLPNGTYTVEAQVIGQTGVGSVNITVKDAPVTHASMAIIPGGSIPVNIRDELSEKGRHAMGSITYGNFSREAKADVSLQPAEEFDWAGFATLRAPRKPHDNDLVLETSGPAAIGLRSNPTSDT